MYYRKRAYTVGSIGPVHVSRRVRLPEKQEQLRVGVSQSTLRAPRMRCVVNIAPKGGAELPILWQLPISNAHNCFRVSSPATPLRIQDTRFLLVTKTKIRSQSIHTICFLCMYIHTYSLHTVLLLVLQYKQRKGMHVHMYMYCH